jgi:hypothetical protein
MKKALLTLTAAFFALGLFAQGTIQKTAGITYTRGAPIWTPSEKTSSEISIDTTTGYLYQWHRTTSTWQTLGQGIDVITGAIAPAYQPLRNQSRFAINGSDELYRYSGSSTIWNCLNCVSSGATNLSFSGASSPYSLNSSTGTDVTISEGANITLARSGNNLAISSSGGSGTVTTNATLTGDGSGGNPLAIAQQSATTSQLLQWSGADWIPSWGNPYTFVTTGAAITTAVNEILIGTVSGDIVMGLPTCSATNDGKRFKFVRNGTDSFSLTIDPSASETFFGGALTKIIYGKISIDCTCRFSGGTGTWFFDNF